MQRGEVRLIDLEPARGSEANKRRPAIIVSNDRGRVPPQLMAEVDEALRLHLQL